MADAALAAPHDVPVPYMERTRTYYQALGYGATESRGQGQAKAVKPERAF